MAINSQKLLPSSKEGGSLSFTKSVISVNKLKPFIPSPLPRQEESNTDSSQQVDQGDKKITIYTVKNQVIRVEKLIHKSSELQEKLLDQKRKIAERDRRLNQEKFLELRKKKKNKLSLDGKKIPGTNILDSILRFLGFTLLGYLVNKWEELWPKLLGLINILKPIIGTIQVIGQAIFNGITTWISRGYMIYDKIDKAILDLGGEGAQKTFREFSDHLKTFVNLAIIAGFTTIAAWPGPGLFRKTPRHLDWRGKIKAGFDATGRRVTQQTMKRWLSRMIAKHGAVEAKNMFIRRFGRENAKLLGEKAFQVATKTVVKETTKQLVIEGLEQTTKQTTKGVVREGGKQLGLRAFGKAFRGWATRIPIFGGLLEFFISWWLGDPVDKAAFRAGGSVLFAWMGGAIGTAASGATFGLGSWAIPVGYAVGGWLGAELGEMLWNQIIGNHQESKISNVQDQQPIGRLNSSGDLNTDTTTTKETNTFLYQEVRVSPV